MKGLPEPAVPQRSARLEDRREGVVIRDETRGPHFDEMGDGLTVEAMGSGAADDGLVGEMRRGGESRECKPSFIYEAEG